MKDKIDILIEDLFQMDYDVNKEINEKILESVKHRNRSKMPWSVLKVAIAILVITGVGTLGVYAATYIMKNVFITDHSISVGNQEYVDDAAIASPEEAVTTENALYEEGNENGRWISKEVQIVNGYATNTYYVYKDYGAAIMDSKLDNWFNTSYENAENVTYVVTETEDFIQHCINASFLYGEGSFYVDEEKMTGNIAQDAACSIKLKNKNNERDYTSAFGLKFTLVDEITDDGTEKKTKTFVMVAYDDCFGYIAFENLKDEEIHKILDTVDIYK